MLIRPLTEKNVSEIGSTDSLLDSGENYESSVFNISTSKNISGTCYADQNGTLYVYQSFDGVNFDYEEEYTYTALEKLGFFLDCFCKYAKIKFINGVTRQTAFRLAWGTA